MPKSKKGPLVPKKTMFEIALEKAKEQEKSGKEYKPKELAVFKNN